MKHTNRMFLIPEDLYQHFFSPPLKNQDGTPLGQIQSKMQHLSEPVATKMNSDERAIRFDQEYKRYSKLQKEQEEKPLNVRLQNLKEVVDNLPQKVEEKKITINKMPRKARHKILKSKTHKREYAPLGVDGDDDDDLVYEDAGIEFPGPSVPTNAADRKKKAMDYVNKNLESLGVNNYGQILQSVANPTSAFKTSNVSTIIDHIVYNGGVRRKPLPTGYEKFVQRISNHPNLVKIIFLKGQRHQSGSGLMVDFKRTYKSDRKNTAFKFKPSLWINRH